MVNLPGYGRAVLTRVTASGGTGQAEIRLRIALADAEADARRQLTVLLADLRTLVTRAALAGQPAQRT